VTSGSQSHAVKARPGWHAFFAEGIRLVVAPVILLLSGFFTMNFLVSGQYTWPRTSRVFALTLTAVILSYEFVYKEQQARSGSAERARASVLFACAVPYLVGVMLMLLLWKL
jgi:hypothetical protein